MPPQKKLAVIVKIDEHYLDRLDDVVSRLKSKGFVLSTSLDAIGVLTGSVSSASLDKIAAVEGVSSVEEDRSDYHTQQP
jgi:hypothetical protein